MPSWSPSEPEDERRKPNSSPTDAATTSDVDAARRLLAELFEDANADDGEPAEPHDQQ